MTDQAALTDELRSLLPFWTPQERVEVRRLVGPLEMWKADPSLLMTDSGLTPDPWQATFLRSSSSRRLLLSCRQAGKSRCAALLGLKEAILRPESLVVIVSRSEEQAAELFREHLLIAWDALGQPLKRRAPKTLELRLRNGSRVLTLAHNPNTAVGKSAVRLLIIDEASRVSDEMYAAVFPFLTVSRGHLMLLSTPFGKRGFFWKAWALEPDWEKTPVRWYNSPRVSRETVEEYRRKFGNRQCSQEYELEFVDTVDAVFSGESIDAAIGVGANALFG
jgi:hypothetical protein